MSKKAVGIFPMEDDEKEFSALLPRPKLAHWIEFDFNPETREIFVDGEISPEFGPWFTKVFRGLLSIDAQAPITVWLNTPGGDMESMFVFHDLVRASTAEVTIIGLGGVASAGCLMLACGHRRLVARSCVLMWHEWSQDAGWEGRYSELKERRQYEDWVHEYWLTLISQYVQPRGDDPERDVTWWRKRTKAKAEWWILGGEAIVQEGFADSLFDGDPAAR